MDMVSALQTRKTFLEKQLIEKRELLNILCLREAVSHRVPPNIAELLLKLQFFRLQDQQHSISQ